MQPWPNRERNSPQSVQLAKGGTAQPNVSAAAHTSAAAEAAARACADAVSEPVRTIMTEQVVSFGPTTTMREATEVMLSRGISGAPVVGPGGKPLGMLSKADLLEAWTAGSAPALTVEAMMVPYLLAVSAEAPISLAAALMPTKGCSV